ncbi:hypothetical protein [Capnocytophaga canimorsus]|uniref:hypothetical protein n=1 Tax=Capnocytophaga canimorsus TaxID=28188 RepID=UPI0037D29163
MKGKHIFVLVCFCFVLFLVLFFQAKKGIKDNNQNSRQTSNGGRDYTKQTGTYTPSNSSDSSSSSGGGRIYGGRDYGRKN